MNSRFLLLLWMTISLIGSLTAQTATDPNEGLRITKDSTGDGLTLFWYGRTGRTYFVQQSPDLLQWKYLPIMDSGTGAPLSYGFSTTASSGFFRLSYTDDPLASDPNGDYDGDGMSNMDELLYAQYGYDPFDYYNGETPTLAFLSGSGQWGAAGTILPLPLWLSVHNGFYNAPVTFSVPSGGALLSLNGTSGWSSSVSARSSVGTYSQGWVAQVYIKLPATVGSISTITASASTSKQTVSVSTWAGVFDPNLSAPVTITAVGIAPDSVEINWTNSDSTHATTIEMSEDDGATWSYVGVAAPGVTSAIVSGLTPDHKVSFRLLTGGTPEGGSEDPQPVFTKTVGKKPPAANVPVSAPSSPPAEATPLSKPLLIGRQTAFYGVKYGFPGFINLNNRYLKRVSDITSVDTDNDNDGGHAVDTTIVDPETGNEDTTRVGEVGATYISGNVAPPTSDTSATEYGEDDEGAEGLESSTSIHTLSNLYTTPTFKTNVESWVPPFTDEFSEYTNTASINLSADELYYDITKLQFKWQVNKDPNLVVYWLEVFTPEDNSPAIIESKSWASSGATESPVFTIDPTLKNGKKNGVYSIAQVEIKQLNYPNFGQPDNTTDLESAASTKVINAGEAAYITGTPGMPTLTTQVLGLSSEFFVDWRLEITSERTERGTKDDKTYTTSGLVGYAPWWLKGEFDFYNDFVGGKCKLSYRLYYKGAYLSQAYSTPIVFYIRGKNPKDTTAKSYIQAQSGAQSNPYAWAICQHESRQSQGATDRCYNQFNSGGSTKEGPNFGAPDGWGIAQLDKPKGVSANTREVYNWHDNIT